jgi:3-oxoacyl-[acyl-carrier-protein] synthase-3
VKKRNVRIAGIGRYLPKNLVTANEIEDRLGVESGWVEAKSGVSERYFITDETTSQMGAIAAQEALAHAGIHLEEIDCIISACAAVEQIIPCTAALIYKKLDPKHSGIPCFDMNSTCLSFVTAMDHISYAIDAGRYRNVLIVSAEISSTGLNWNHKESGSLFGDAAVAVVLSRTPQGESSAIITSHMETYTQGAHLAEIRGLGVKNHPRTYDGEINMEDFLFTMDGQAIFKMSARLLPGFIKRLFCPVDHLELRDMKLVIPHQASMMALRIMQKRLNLTEEQFLIIVNKYGNNIAASIPMGLYDAIHEGRIQRDDHVLLLGTSAGLSLGGLIFVY